MNKDEYDARYREVLERDGRITPVYGAFSDLKPDLAYVEEEKVDHRGKVRKFIGCHAWCKFNSDRELHNDTTALKGFYMETLKLVLKHPILFLPPLTIIYLLFRDDLIEWAWRCWHKRKDSYPPITHLSPMCREIVRAFQTDNQKLKDLAKAFATFIQSSSSYYVRTQDILWELRKDKNIVRVLQLALERDRNQDELNPNRIEYIIKAVRLPFVRGKIKSYLDKLDYSQFKYDDEDIYWAYRKETYDTLGVSQEERSEYVKKVDEEQGNLILINEDVR